MNTITCSFNQYESDLTISLNQLKLGVFQLSLRHEFVRSSIKSQVFDLKPCLSSVH